jgi:beta-lactamase class A
MPQYSRYPSSTQRQPMLSKTQQSRLAPSRPQRRPLKPGLWMVVVGIILLISCTGYFKHVSAEAAASRTAQALSMQHATTRSQRFSQQLSSLETANPAIDVSVAIHSSLLGQQYFGIPGDYDGASTGKLITASDYLHHVEVGTASLSQQIDGESAQDWLQAMIVNSDDTAWSVLNTFLGHPDLARYASSIDLSHYNPTTNTFSAGDIASLLVKLQSGSLLNPSHQRLLMGYMKVANYRQYMVPAIPAGYTIYHKVGLDEDNVHDAAIIEHNGQSIELVIFTNGNGTYNWDARASLIQTITSDALTAYLPE